MCTICGSSRQFWETIDLLANKRTGPASAFLWPKAEGGGSWPTIRLRNVLEREAKVHLNTKLNITSYGHAAIAISRVHLKCVGFKRDYGVLEKEVDQQASHSAWVAGTVYARGLQEALGHVEARRAQYRAISREWHGFLGFVLDLGLRKRDCPDGGEELWNPLAPPAKRTRPYVMVEMQDEMQD